MDDRLLGAAAEIVAVEGDVEVAARDLALEQIAQQVTGGAAWITLGRWMPTIARPGVPSPVAFFSTISWAMRTSVRRMSSPSRTTFPDSNAPPFWVSRDPVKGTRRP